MPLNIPELLKNIPAWLAEKKYDQVIATCNEILTQDPGNTEAESYLTQAKTLKESMPLPEPLPAQTPEAETPLPVEIPEIEKTGKKKTLIIAGGIALILIIGIAAYFLFFNKKRVEKSLADFIPGEKVEAIIHVKKSILSEKLLEQTKGSEAMPKEILQNVEELLFAGNTEENKTSYAVAFRIAKEKRENVKTQLQQKLPENVTLEENEDVFIVKNAKTETTDVPQGKLTENPLLASLEKHPYHIAAVFDMKKTAEKLKETLQNLAQTKNAPPGVSIFLEQLKEMQKLGAWINIEENTGKITIELGMATEETAKTLHTQLSAFLGIAQLAIPAEERENITFDLQQERNGISIVVTVQNFMEKIENIAKRSENLSLPETNASEQSEPVIEPAEEEEAATPRIPVKKRSRTIPAE